MTLVVHALLVKVAIHEREETYLYETVTFKSERSEVQFLLTRVDINVSPTKL